MVALNLTRPMLSGVIAIYQIINTITGKRYVGSAKNHSKRFQQHRADLRRGVHRNTHLQASWNKYGESAFEFNVVEVLPSENMLLEREQHWIDSEKPEYNICQIAGSSLGLKRSEETKEKISKSLQGVKHPEWRRRLKSLAQGGDNHWTKKKKFSEEAKRNMSEAQKRLYANGYIHPSKKTILQLSRDGTLIQKWGSVKSAAEHMGLTPSAITQNLIGKNKTSGGFIWKYDHA